MARGVEADQLGAVPQDTEGVGAAAVVGRLGYGDGDGAGDRGIDGVAASGQHAQAGGGGEVLRGGDDVGGKDWKFLGGVGKIVRKRRHLENPFYFFFSTDSPSM